MITEILMQSFWIRKMHSLKIEQVTKEYGPSWHEKTKIGTPTMGGVVFIPVYILALAVFFAASVIEFDWKHVALYSYPVLAAVTGFIDDWMKHTKNSSDGLTSLQKLSLQIFVTLAWIFMISPQNIEFLPGVVLPVWITVPVILFAGVGFQNAVNVTDGLDGLAAGAVLISLLFAVLFLSVSRADLFMLFCSIGITMGFLWHNSNPATVFMGDVGAHFFAGLLFAVCVSAKSAAFIVPLGFLFGLEIISVSIQIFAIRKLHRKVFLMSPVHHHFEMLGWNENKIVSRFLIVHATGVFLLIIMFYRIAEFF